MSLDPILNAQPVIILHILAATAAVLVGAVQFAGVKGNMTHRILGWLWVISMLIVAISSFWIHEIRQFGAFSMIHILSIVTLVSLIVAITAARQHNTRTHKYTMISLFFGGLLIAGLFTFVPGRLLHVVLFGT